MARIRRNAELGLILLGSVIVVGAYVLASLGQNASIPVDLGPFLAAELGLILFAHIATRRLAPSADGILLPLAVLLNGIGYVFIARLAGERSVPSDLPGLQATWFALGMAAYVGTLLVIRRIRVLDQYRYTVGLIGLALLFLPLVPGVGRTINGAKIWISLGPINLQPGEFAKLALAVFFASYLVDKRELLRMATYRLGPLWLPEPKHFFPILVAWAGSVVVMVSERDLGSSLLYFALFVVLLWIATERVAYLVVGVGLFAVGAFAAWRFFDHVQQRVDIWLDPWADPLDEGFQIVEAQYALAEGGLTGTGIGLGDPARIPVVENDFIFAAIGEEMGLLGSTAIIVSYLLFVGTGLRIALRAVDPIAKLLAVGLTTIIGLQAFIIIGGVIRVVPLTGITLPYVSYGGSSLLANYVLLALLIRISDESAQRGRIDADAAGVVGSTAP